MRPKSNRLGCRPGRCQCRQRLPGTAFSNATKATKTLPSTLVSLFIAFFPKCPVCWAAYMSMFGCVGLSKMPYMKWLFPFLLVLLGLHLFMLYRSAKRKGYWPFLISVFGSSVVIISRTLFPMAEPLLLLGVIAVATGSLLNGFISTRPIYITQKIFEYGNLSAKSPPVDPGHL